MRIKSPDLSHELEGGVYIAEQTNNPFGSLFALYIVAEDPALGIRVKLAGEVSLNEETGQITSTFSETPQVPFEALRPAVLRRAARVAQHPGTVRHLHHAGIVHTLVERDTARCAKPAFRSPAAPKASVARTRCRSRPALKAGSSSPQAGAFTTFTLTLTDPDADQRLSRAQRASAGGDRRDPRVGHALPRTPGRTRTVRPGKPDRPLAGERRATAANRTSCPARPT